MDIMISLDAALVARLQQLAETCQESLNDVVSQLLDEQPASGQEAHEQPKANNALARIAERMKTDPPLEWGAGAPTLAERSLLNRHWVQTCRSTSLQ